MDRQTFSSEGFPYSDTGIAQGELSPSERSEGGIGGGGSLKRGVVPSLKFSHFASVESAEVLKAATTDLIRIFQLQVHVYSVHVSSQ